MSRTRRWWHKPKSAAWLKAYDYYFHSYKVLNPCCYSHESKFVRTKIHRAYRRCNKVRIAKGMDAIVERKTNGWNTW